MIRSSTKAANLEKLERLVTKSKVFPQICFNALDWNQAFIKSKIAEKGWENRPLIVRSSACQEDRLQSSLAGHFISVNNVQTSDELFTAINQVISSYKKVSNDDMVFIQPMLLSAKLSGVAFSYDPRTGAPYRVINYDDESGRTDSVTSGITNQLKVYYAHRSDTKRHPEQINKIIEMMKEVESLFEHHALDIEFAISKSDELFLFQVRPLFIHTAESSFDQHKQILYAIESQIENFSRQQPDLLGAKSIFGIMSDWNPAEMIGVKPRPLALSLYREILTDSIIACGRNDYGYRNLKGFPFLVDFQGLPYIDIRVSFNSFIPKDLNHELASKLVDYYLAKLEAHPHLHDKIEFEVVHSCLAFDYQERLSCLKEAGFSQTELIHLTECLRNLTNSIIKPNGLFSKDLQKTKMLMDQFEKVEDSSCALLSQIQRILDDCKQYGTLPFVGIARAAFIAIELLESLVHVEIISQAEMDAFLSSLNTISTQMQNDRLKCSKVEFLDRYGHLREGTYDILSPRYDEEENDYLDWSITHRPLKKCDADFVLNTRQTKQINKALKEQGLHLDAYSLFDFIKSAIEGREYSKFLFTKHVSQILLLIKQLGRAMGFTPEECAYLDLQDIKKLCPGELDAKHLLSESFCRGKQNYTFAKEILLPPLITNPHDVWSFDLKQAEPNFITLKKVKAPVCLYSSGVDITGKIVMIPMADPGYDWIFTYPLSALITMYGGVNSHMAIRAAELGLPAVIGAGEVLYNLWSQAQSLEIDCENKNVKMLFSFSTSSGPTIGAFL